jgi:tetratricopeptide (TPR) repeat protein
MRQERLGSIRVLLPRSRPEILERLLELVGGLLTLAAAIAAYRGDAAAMLALLGAALGLAGVVVGALRPESALVEGPFDVPTGTHTLPASPTQFVGRRIRIALALRYLRYRRSESRVLAISGMPGVGKTALALVIARQLRRTSYPDNQLFIQLGGGLGGEPQPVRSSTAALFEALVQLKVPAAEIPAGRTQRRDLYRQKLAGSRSLVVLDDASDARQVEDLRPPDGSATIVTCRVELGPVIAKGARRLRLRPLSTLQALRLLANRLGRPWRVARQPVSALRLVNLYGRLPLALECVAARLAISSGEHLPFRAVLVRLEDWRIRLEFASAGVDYGVALALHVSYQALIEEQQRAFCVFGLLNLPELDEEVVAAVLLITPARARKLLSQVADAGLLEVIGEGDRWRAHELALLYARLMVVDVAVEVRQEAVQRAVEVYLRRIRTLQDLLGSPVGQLDPERAAAVRTELEAELAHKRQAARALADQAARIGLDLAASLAGDLLELFGEILSDWPDPPDRDRGGPTRESAGSGPPWIDGTPRPGPDHPRHSARPAAPHATNEPPPRERANPADGPDRWNGSHPDAGQQPSANHPPGRPQPPRTAPWPGPASPPPTPPPSPPTVPRRWPPSGPPRGPDGEDGDPVAATPPPRAHPPGTTNQAAPPPDPGEPGQGAGGGEPAGSADRPDDPGRPTPDPSTNRGSKGGPGPSGGAPSTAAPPPPGRRRRHRPPPSAPAARGSFVGRDRELQALHAGLTRQGDAAIPQPPVVLITGLDAVGKWTLALQLARQLTATFPGGCLPIDLSGVGGAPPDLDDTLAALLHLQGHSATDIAAMTPADRQRRYQAWFEGKRALVLVRNASEADFLDRLLPTSPTSAVIITSPAEPPRLAATVHCHLGPLSEPEAVELLARSSGRSDLRDDPASVWLARWYGCHPLLLRCVGAWMGDRARVNVPAARLAAAVIDRGPPVAPGMDPELLRRLGRCSQLVPPSAARLYRLLALLEVPDVDAGMAAALAKISPEQAEARLSRLASLCLLERVGPDAGRFRLPPLLRPLAASHSRLPWSAVERRLALERAVEYYVGQLDPPGITDPTRAADRVEWFQQNRLNLVAAVVQASRARLHRDAFALASSMAKFCEAGGYLAAWQRTAELGITAARRLRSPSAIPRADANLADVLVVLDRPDEAIETYQGALARCQDQHAALFEARVFAGLGRAYQQLGEPTEAIANYRKSLQRLPREGIGSERRARVWSDLGATYAAAGQFEEAAKAYNNSSRRYFHGGDLHATQASLVGHLSALDHFPDPQERVLQERKLSVLRPLAAIQEDLGQEAQAAETLLRLGEVHELLDQKEEAASRWQQSADLFYGQHNYQLAAETYLNAGTLQLANNQFTEATETLGSAAKLFEELDDQVNEAQAQQRLGRAWLGVGEPAKAITALEASTDCYQQAGRPESLDAALEAAHSHLELGQDWYQLDRFEEAEAALGRSVELLDGLDERDRAADAYVWRAKALIALDRPTEAADSLKLAGDCAWRVGDLSAAQESFASAKDLYEQHNLIQKAQDVGDQLAEVATLAAAPSTHEPAQIVERELTISMDDYAAPSDRYIEGHGYPHIEGPGGAFGRM